MEPLYDIASLRGLEQCASRALDDGFALMQRAGEAAWRCALARWPRAQRIVVICGAGNNGGDGYLFAMHATRSGRAVRVLQVGAPRTQTARRALAECTAAGCVAEPFGDTLPAGDLLVDALFGIGLARAPEGAAMRAIAAMRAFAGPVLAIDVPSGVDADSGHVPGIAVRATVTLQMLGAHRGLATGEALDHVGECELATLEVACDGDIRPAAEALRASDLAHWLPSRPRNSHKGLYGHVLCVGGDHGSGGAVVMCAEAALRSGAGLVSVATRAGHVAPLLARRPEAMPKALDDAEALAPLLRRASVVAIGPGLGKGEWGRALLAAALEAGKPLVLDADALNLLADAPRALPADAILTPHPGEAARLLDCDTRDVQADRFAATAHLVERYACTVVLKGAGTIIATPDARQRVVTTGNPGMATGGMGDVLTGVIAALRAQGLGAFDAASCGALLHGAAGDAAGFQLGERGLLATDLLPALHRLANPSPDHPGATA